MNNDTTTHRSPLTRSSTNRKLSGVAGGLGAYTGVDPIIFRIGFVVGTLITGGALAVGYLLMLAYVPADDATPSNAIPAH
jgi:phage shock protein C